MRFSTVSIPFTLIILKLRGQFLSIAFRLNGCLIPSINMLDFGVDSTGAGDKSADASNPPPHLPPPNHLYGTDGFFSPEATPLLSQNLKKVICPVHYWKSALGTELLTTYQNNAP